MKYFEKKTEPIPFLKDWWRNNEENGGSMCENDEFGRRRDGQNNEQSQNAREKWKFLKTALKITLIVQNTCISRLEWVANKLPSQVAKNPCDKFWKICLSIFRDWKVHSQVSHKRSRETFWVKLMTRASTHKLVAKVSCENEPRNLKFF